MTKDATTAASGRDYSNHPITADDMLSAARAHARYLKTVRPRDYAMRIFEDGSVDFRNVFHSGLGRRYTLAEIQAAAGDFRLSPHRSLFQHVRAVWA